MLFTPYLFKLSKARKKDFIGRRSLLGQSVCVIPRSDCSFRRIKIAKYSKKTLQALRLRVERESNQEEDSFTIRVDNDRRHASVWGYKKPVTITGRCLPESLARKPLKDGARLVKSIQGYEAQLWKNGSVISSRWWRDKPSPQAWQTFLLGAQGEIDIADTSLPTITEIPYRTDLPIFEFEKAQLLTNLSPLRTGLALAVLTVISFMYISGKVMHNSLSLQSTRAEIDNISDSTALILSQKRRALSNLRTIQSYQDIGHPASLFFALVDINEVLGGNELLIERLSLISGEIEIVLLPANDEPPQIAVPKIVAELESRPSLSGVNISFGANNRIILKSRVMESWDYQALYSGAE